MNKRFVVKDFLGTGNVVASFDSAEEAEIYCNSHEMKDDCLLWWDTKEGE